MSTPNQSPVTDPVCAHENCGKRLIDHVWSNAYGSNRYCFGAGQADVPDIYQVFIAPPAQDRCGCGAYLCEQHTAEQQAYMRTPEYAAKIGLAASAQEEEKADACTPMSNDEVDDLLRVTLHGPLPSATLSRVFATLCSLRADLAAMQERSALPELHPGSVNDWRQVAEEKQRRIESFRADIQEKNDRIAHLQTDLAAKDARIAELEIALTEKDRIIAATRRGNADLVRAAAERSGVLQPKALFEDKRVERWHATRDALFAVVTADYIRGRERWDDDWRGELAREAALYADAVHGPLAPTGKDVE